jgi:hypothetical protein
MKITHITARLSVLVGLVLIIGASVALAAPSTVQAASGPPTIVKFNGQSAVAEFDTVSGGIETFVLVVGTKPSGAADPQVVVVVGQFDVTSGTTLLFASGSTSTATVQFGPSLSAATASATVPLTDSVSGNSLSVDVQVAWTASSPLIHQHNTTVSQTTGFTSIFHSNASLREASASGAVSTDSTNFTPSSSVLAQILRVNSAQITITHT